jgi:hypothetical protein
MLRDHEVFDRPSTGEVLVNNALENWRIAESVPGTFRIDDRNRPAFTDTQAVGFGPQDTSLLGQAELLQTPLEELPCRQSAFLVAAFRVGLIAAEKNVSPRHRHTDGDRDLLLRSRHVLKILRSNHGLNS